MHFRVGQLGIYREEWVGTKEEETLHIRDRSWDREKQCWKKVIPGSESFVGLTQGKQTICVKVGVGDGDDDDEVDAWCQCVSGPGESLSIQNWPYPPTTSTRYTSLPLKPPTAHYKHTTDTPPKKKKILTTKITTKHTTKAVLDLIQHYDYSICPIYKVCAVCWVSIGLPSFFVSSKCCHFCPYQGPASI